MLLWLPLPLLAALLFAPVTVHITAQANAQWSVSITMSLGPLRLLQRRLPAPSSGKKRRHTPVSLQAVRQSGVLRRLLRHGRVQQLRITGSIALADAAHAALLCGAVNTLTGAVRLQNGGRLHIALLPDFWSGRQNLAAECIISFRLGILLTDAAVLLRAMRRRPAPHKED